MKRRIQLRGLVGVATLFVAATLVVSPGAFAQDPTPEPTPTQEPSQQEPSQDPSQGPTQPNPSSGQSAPKPAGRQTPILNDDDSQVKDPNAMKPDTNALTGVLVPTVGSPEMRHSYFVPGFQYGNFVRSSTIAQPTISDWNTTSYVAGNLSLLEQWSNAALAVNYSGGGVFSTDKTEGDGSFHQLNLVQAFTFKRWQLAFVDGFSYLPQTEFGFGASSTLSVPGISGPLGPILPALQTSYQPNQSIFTALGPRYSNSATTEIVYALSARGALTFAGSYGILRFVQSGNVETNDVILSTGYNYAVTKNDTVGVLYRFTGYEYLGAPQRIQDHVIQAAFGHKVTGRTALQFFVGPEISSFRVPFNGETSRVSVSGGANVSYALSRTTMTASYTHGVAGGSGVFTGSLADQVEFTVSRRLSRVWTGRVNVGYAHNSVLGKIDGAPSTSAIGNWFAGANVARQIGRTANFTAGYTAYYESGSQLGCVTGSCNSYVQHEIAMSFQWHTRPFVLR